MLTGYPPFQSKTQEEIYKKVRNLSYVWPKESEGGNHIPGEARSLVSSCLNLAENERPDPDDIVEHPFFNMYEGCIPKQLERTCCHTKPVWLKPNEPRGDQMLHGYSLDYDHKLLGYIEHVDDPSQRYHSGKAAFYALCGVGRKPDGAARKAAGKNCSKSAYAECLTEEERGLQPVIPMPEGTVYSYPHDPEGDWSLPDPVLPLRNDGSGSESSVISSTRTVSIRSNAAAVSKTQAALAAAQQRRMESQSHAASLRQQAIPTRAAVRKPTVMCDAQGPASRPLLDTKELELEAHPIGPLPMRGLADKPIRTRRGVAPYLSSSGDVKKDAVPQTGNAGTASGMLTVARTRSQSRRLESDNQGKHLDPPRFQERSSSTATVERLEKTRVPSLRPDSRIETREPPKTNQKETEDFKQERVDGKPRPLSGTQSQGIIRSSSSKTSLSGSKSRSSLGVHALFHPEDPCELLPGTSINEVNTDLRHMLSSLVSQTSARRRPVSKRSRHAYVIKWVDYTNRYGIGYVLDDGSVGCVFKAENGRPASSVVMRDGEKHVRRKARASEKEGNGRYVYSESNQLVPRNGKPVEFYENCDEDSFEYRGGIRRAFIPPPLFEVKSSQSGGSNMGVKIRINAGVECARADAEKIKRVKLVDQFGKYMIGSLGRHGDEGLSDEESTTESYGQYIKFYERLGNVGIWGFGDGAFQVGNGFEFCVSVADHNSLISRITPNLYYRPVEHEARLHGPTSTTSLQLPLAIFPRKERCIHPVSIRGLSPRMKQQDF